jgi:uncharacterized repeat protein (TIGR03803 family)
MCTLDEALVSEFHNNRIVSNRGIPNLQLFTLFGWEDSRDMGKLDALKTICALSMFCIATAIATPAQTFKTLYNFCSLANCTDAANPRAGLIQGTNGNLYGTTYSGGANNYGTVFEITTGGKLTTLYSFCSSSGCTDGSGPSATLVLATNGSFYGTTYEGGSSTIWPFGSGTVFEVTSEGKLRTLHTFCTQLNDQGFCGDGNFPGGGLVQATDENFYGTTTSGGAYGYGTVFRITMSGTFTTLYSFCAAGQFCPDGRDPSAALVQGTDGDLYGTTFGGGSAAYGTAFKITTAGTLTTLYTFCSQEFCDDGAFPDGPMTQDSQGNFYGTTWSGGTDNGGTVFEITPEGTLTTLHIFSGQYGTDGGNPEGTLAQGANRNFYGTTSSWGASTDANCLNQSTPCGGTAFEITPKGILTTLYSFCTKTSCADGSVPYSGLFQATNGILYGTTSLGGASNSGTAFSVSVGFSSFVETNPTSGKAGTEVTILGSDLAGATRVTFNGTLATFKASSTYITTTVPTGATTGTVEVVTPEKTLKSNVPFRVP